MKLVDDNGNIIGVVIGDTLHTNLTKEDVDEMHKLITHEIDCEIIAQLRETALRIANAAKVNMPLTPNVDTWEK